MNAYLTAMTTVIHHHGGTIDKYIGDAIMAFWGAPLPDPEHPSHAMAAALEMQAAAENLRGLFVAMGWPELHIGVGLNSGTMSVGNMGSRFRRAYTVLGDRVNLASRLEGLTKKYGVGVIVGEDTAACALDFAFREIDRVRVRGKHEPVSVYEPIGPLNQLTDAKREELARFANLAAAYRAGEWAEANRLCTELRKEHPEDSIYALYQERIAFFMSTPPPADWDGVFTFTSK
jgi:adenylate cyclase